MATETWDDVELDREFFPPDEDYYWADLENGCE